MAVALQAAADDLALQRVEGDELGPFVSSGRLEGADAVGDQAVSLWP